MRDGCGTAKRISVNGRNRSVNGTRIVPQIHEPSPIHGAHDACSRCARSNCRLEIETAGYGVNGSNGISGSIVDDRALNVFDLAFLKTDPRSTRGTRRKATAGTANDLG